MEQGSKDGKQLFGVSFRHLRDAGWRAIIGLHPTNLSRMGGYAPSIRLPNGYYVPSAGLHSLDLPRQIDSTDQLDSQLWHDIFTFNHRQLAWPQTEHHRFYQRGWRSGAEHGWVELPVDGETWVMHTSVSGLRRLMHQFYASAADWRVECNAQERRVDIFVQEGDVPLWLGHHNSLADLIATALHFEVVNVHPLPKNSP